LAHELVDGALDELGIAKDTSVMYSAGGSCMTLVPPFACVGASAD
jgi:hypothetical protein